MAKKKKQVSDNLKYLKLLTGGSLILTIASWFKADRIIGGSIFVVMPPTPEFTGHGFPWWFHRLYAKGGSEFYYALFFYDACFWFILHSILLFLYLAIQFMFRFFFRPVRTT